MAGKYPHTPSRSKPDCPIGLCVLLLQQQLQVHAGCVRHLDAAADTQIEGSVLWLSASNDRATENLRNEASKRGVSPDRLIFASRVGSNEDHLARLRLGDLFLDTLYYNAHTTACDALWAGLPVVTHPGQTFASRVAGSLLNAVGLPELIVPSLEDYEALALKLAREPAKLAAIKEKLARNIKTHPLFDTAHFTRHMEAAYRTMWQCAQRAETPKAFAVDPGARLTDTLEQ